MRRPPSPLMFVYLVGHNAVIASVVAATLSDDDRSLPEDEPGLITGEIVNISRIEAFG